MVAYEVNRKRLATMLLEFEPRRADRVRMRMICQVDSITPTYG